MSKTLNTGDIWPIIKVSYLASSPPERKQANDLLFYKWLQWKPFSFLNNVFIHIKSIKSMVEVFAKAIKGFGDLEKAFA